MWDRVSGERRRPALTWRIDNVADQEFQHRHGSRRFAGRPDPRPRPRRPRRPRGQPRDGVHGGRARQPGPARAAAVGHWRRSISRRTGATSSSRRRTPTSRSGCSCPSCTTATRCSSTGWSVSTCTRCCRSSTRRRWVRPSRSSATCSVGRGASSSTSRTWTGSTGRSTPRGWVPTTSTWSWPPTPRRSWASVTGASVASTSRSASLRCTRSPPASTRGGSWPWGWTWARTRRCCSTTPATSGSPRSRVRGAEYDAFIDAVRGERLGALPEGDPALGGLLGSRTLAGSSRGTATVCAPSTTTSRAPPPWAWPACWPGSGSPAVASSTSGSWCSVRARPGSASPT